MGSPGKKRGRSGKPRSTGRKGRELPDLGAYIAFAIIWIFFSGLMYLTAPAQAPMLSTAFLAGLALYVSVCVVNAYLGKKLFRWQRGLARLPLIVVGAGNRPVRSMKGEPAARNAAILAGVAGVVLIVATVLVGVRTMQ